MDWIAPQDEAFVLDDRVYVWRFDVPGNGRVQDRLFSILDAEEQAKARRFHFDKDRNCFVTSRANLRLLISSYLNTEPEQVRFEYNDFGKPVLQNPHSTLQFNVSHSGTVALVAFHKIAAIGVDVEKYRNDVRFKDIARRFFSEREIDTLFSLPDKQIQTGFYNCWTRKEAFIKAVGKGLSIPLNSFDVTLFPGTEATIEEIRTDIAQIDYWTLKSLDPGNGYSGAVVCALPDFELVCWQGRQG